MIPKLPLSMAAVALAASLGGVAAADRDLAGDALGDAKVLVNRDKDGIALQGYDPVAYFTDGKPVQGDPRFHARYKGATYLFASADHLALFEASPKKYEPAFGGWCGYAASIDRLSPISPEFFQVLGGRLVLQHNKKAWDLWNADVAGNLAKADANWPGLVERNGTSVRSKRLINLDADGLAIRGYDPVAYFTDDRPVQGEPAIVAHYDGATYRFASEEHRAAFELDPSRYVPAFGGYCGYAASINKVSPIDPAIFQIIDGRLVLQHTPKAYELFNRNAPRSLAKADRNWPRLVERHGK